MSSGSTAGSGGTGGSGSGSGGLGLGLSSPTDILTAPSAAGRNAEPASDRGDFDESAA
jgi:hypothetical protein